MVSRVCVGEEANWPEDAVVHTAWADVEASLPGTEDVKLTGLNHSLRLFAAQTLLFSVSCSVFFPASFQVSLSKIDTSGEYVPLRFSMEHYTCNGKMTRQPGFLSVCLSDCSSAGLCTD